MSTIDAAVRNNVNRGSIITSITLGLALFLYLFVGHDWRQATLFLVGLFAGISLYHASFGFTAAWREVVNTGRGDGLRAQMVMLAVTVLIFVPLISMGEVGDTGLRGSVAPLSVGVVFGAFLFGIGMQLGGGCASGTLFTAGGGNIRMLITLSGFIAGSLLGTWHWAAWRELPAIAPFSLMNNFGAVAAVVISLILFGIIWTISARYEKFRNGTVQSLKQNDSQYSWFYGPWPLLVGALSLALVNIATLMLAGRPWGVTSAFALWGAKIATLSGFDVTTWAYWQRPAAAAAIDRSIFFDITSVMNIGILLGALLAAGLASRFAPNFRLPFRSIAAALIGGLLLGYGARIAYGCNIGAYFSGISSTSLHGWVWFFSAFIGSSIGARLRPYFGLSQ